MNERPVRLVLRDDLRRSRLTVFFRLFLAIPHLFWFWIWASAVSATVFVQWLVTVVRARPITALNTFHVHFVRYGAQLTAYVALAANPFPGFLGEPGYPVEVEIDPAERQSRLSAGFRLLLAIPALWMLALVNSVAIGGAFAVFLVGAGVVFTAAFLGWFAALVRGTMPRGLRNIAAYGIRYTAEVWAYLLLVVERYPSSDPTLPGEAGALPFRPIRLVVTDDRRRSRLTTFFRGFLVVPHIVWLVLWGVVVVLAVLVNWFVLLARGRGVSALDRFVAAYLRYQLHVAAFLWLIANPFPGFAGRQGYPVDLEIDRPDRQARLVTAFRLFLAIPSWIISGALQWLVLAAGIGGWFAALVTGRMPEGLRNAGAHGLRYVAQANGYAYLLTDRYPFAGPPTEAQPPQLLLDEAP